MKNRKTIRLPEYDYSLPGEYFITICVHESKTRLGQIIQNQIELSAEGCIVNKWIKNTLTKFTGIVIEHFVIMPNHIHLIIEIRENNNHLLESLIEKDTAEELRKRRRNMLLPEVISYLKANSAREINRLNNISEINFWQKNYYEHIIRNENEYQKTVDYIVNNPFNWEEDKYNKNLPK